MARFTTKIDPEFQRQLEMLGNIDDVAPKMVDESTPIIEQKLKQAFAGHSDSGAMVNSIKAKKAVQTKNGGWFAPVRATGKDKKGVRNMEKMAYFEFGTSKMSPDPKIAKVVNDSEEEVNQRMQEVFERETKL